MFSSIPPPPDAPQPPRLRVTVWRLLNSIVVVGFAMTKAGMAYAGYNTVLTPLEWILGAFWFLVYVIEIYLCLTFDFVSV